MGDNALPYHWTYSRNGNDITGQPLYAESDADSATAWDGAHGSDVLISLCRTPRGRWRIESEGAFRIPVSAYARRFGSPDEALKWAAERADLVPVPAVCRCGEPGGECD